MMRWGEIDNWMNMMQRKQSVQIQTGLYCRTC